MEEKCLWGIIDELRDDVNAHIDAITDMDAVNDTYQGEIFKLEADIKQLKADIKHDADVCYDVDDEHVKTIEKLKADIIKLENHVDKYGSIAYDELQDERNTLKYALENYQCGCKYPKELKADAEEYFENNPHETKLFYFVVGASGCEEDGDVINSLNCECDAVAEFDNYDGIVSGEVFK